MNVIEVQGLTKRYGDKIVVDNLSLSVREGEISGFLGPNGSGKTTTIRMMCGLLIPNQGTGRVLGMDLRTQAAKIKREVGYMTQRFSFYEDLTIEENLAFVARIYQLKPAHEHVKKALDRLGLTQRRSQLAGRLSGGWKQRLALAASVMHTPRLLLLDEPTAGVDPKARRDFWDEIHGFASDGMTVLVSTHYMDEAERCHRINYIFDGRLLTGGTVAEVIDQAGLTTIVLERARADEAIDRLSAMDGVDQVAPFGLLLHVVGQDRAALQSSVDQIASEFGLVASQGSTSLEDVFIQLMKAPMAAGS